MDFLFKAKFSTQWHNIDTLRNTIVSLLYHDVTNQENAHQISMACTELMENACKYSAAPEAMIEVQRDRDTKGEIYVAVTNVVSDNQVKTFEEIYGILNKGSSEEAYKRMVLRSVEMDKVMQIGLARVRYELGTEIGYEVSHDVRAFLDEEKRQQVQDNWHLLKVMINVPLRRTTD